MDVVLEILKYALPAIFLLILCYLMLSNFMDNEEKRRLYFLKKETQKSALPVRLQAYERLSLFLERISPERLLVRVHSDNLNVREYQTLLTEAIRSEFEHNVSQQIYISDEAWKLVVNAKSATVGIINTIANEMNGKDNGLTLRKAILNKTMEMENFPTKGALRYLKAEVRKNF